MEYRAEMTAPRKKFLPAVIYWMVNLIAIIALVAIMLMALGLAFALFRIAYWLVTLPF